MEKMVITLVIEGRKEDLNTIKGNIISTACETIVSVSTSTIERVKDDIKIPSFILEK